MAVYDNNGVNVAYYYFHYVPNEPLIIVSITIFGIFFVLLTARVLHTKSPKYILMLPLTALLEMIGFVLRYVCSENPTTSLYSAMSVLLLFAANIMAMVNYKAVGDVVRLSGVEKRFGIIGPNLGRQLFRSNVVASILQAVGSGIAATSSTRQEGFAIAVVGIALNLGVFALFMVITYYVDSRPEYHYKYNGKSPKHILMRVMYATMILLIARLAYRLAGYIIAYQNPFAIHEWTFYVFDALLIALCFLIHFIWFVGYYIPHHGADFDSSGNNGYDMNNVNDVHPQGADYLTPEQKFAQQQQEYARSNPVAAYNNA